MGVEGERLAVLVSLEQGKRGCVHVAPALVVVPLEDLPRPVLHGPVEVHEIDEAKMLAAIGWLKDRAGAP